LIVVTLGARFNLDHGFHRRTETRKRYVCANHRQKRGNNEHPNSQEVAEPLHRALGLGGRIKNKITQNYPDRGGNQTEKEAHGITSIETIAQHAPRNKDSKMHGTTNHNCSGADLKIASY
jgi:hypothetical protein